MNKLLSIAAATALTAIAGTSTMNFAEVYEKECQGCHGPIHQGGVGSDLRPKALKAQSREFLTERIMEGVPPCQHGILAFQKMMQQV